MSSSKKKNRGRSEQNDDERNGRRGARAADAELLNLHPDVKKGIGVVACIGIGILLILAAAGQAGPWGGGIFTFLKSLFGIGYYLLPLVSFLFAFSLLGEERRKFVSLTLIGGGLFVLAGLGFIDVVSSGSGGFIGSITGALKGPFGAPASLVLLGVIAIISFLVTVNRPIHLFEFMRKLRPGKMEEFSVTAQGDIPDAEDEISDEEEVTPKEAPHPERAATVVESKSKPGKPMEQRPIRNYVAPPLSLLSSVVEKPTAGDLQANANIIRRTLESFGVPVEMGEINVGPTITRYTLKPAEGVKLARITSLSSDLALALAAHPIRIEAPIPGKSLVGIEVPNKAAALVRLGSLFLYPEFQKTGALSFALGRNVQGDPVFPNVETMPHLLVAGATGSGKSIAIHSLIISLIYKNSPETLNLIMIDPKRVELSIYAGLPHLIAPVVTDNKHAIGALRWVIQEMDRRYQSLLEAGSRDIKSYNASAPRKLPYIVVIIDELADLMATYGREVEGSIIRLAQMARATGIHLVVSTQRPSVEVITGLIKANITTRVALQVASQVDSRTILDNAGAEKLLGRGDLLYVSAELSKPRRLQGAYVTEAEIKAVAKFIVENNEAPREVITIETSGDGSTRLVPAGPEDGILEEGGDSGSGNGNENLFADLSEDSDDDELYIGALEVVRVAKKASASLLQRRLKVGYARAARLLDMMEERGVIGPGDGAKPREILQGE